MRSLSDRTIKSWRKNICCVSRKFSTPDGLKTSLYDLHLELGGKVTHMIINFVNIIYLAFRWFPSLVTLFPFSMKV